MHVPDALAELDRHQHLILGQIAAGRDLLDGEPRKAQAELAKVRWHMVRLLRAYQLFKHVEIFDPIIASEHVRRAPLARGLKAACVAAGEGYQAYTLHWSATGIERDWPAYVTGARDMARSLDHHLAAERMAVASLLSDMSRTRKA